MVRGAVLAGSAAIVICLLGGGAAAPAAGSGKHTHPARAIGSSCGHALRWTFPRKLVRRLLSPGRWAAYHRASGGPLIHVSTNFEDPGTEVKVSITKRGWRVCTLGSGPPTSWIAGAVKKSSGASEVDNLFIDNPRSLWVTYAKRNPVEDGASCADPYVVYTDGSGDAFAGNVALTQDGNINETAHHMAQWSSKPGYRTCYASGASSIGGPGRPWIDRRPSGNRTMDTFECCPNHYEGGRVLYVYAAFRRA